MTEHETGFHEVDAAMDGYTRLFLEAAVLQQADFSSTTTTVNKQIESLRRMAPRIEP